jgi:hypothetical protein
MSYRDDFAKTRDEVFWTAPKVAFGMLVLVLLLLVTMFACNVLSLPIWFASRSFSLGWALRGIRKEK